MMTLKSLPPQRQEHPNCIQSAQGLWFLGFDFGVSGDALPARLVFVHVQYQLPGYHRPILPV
eukprot:1708619-Rhodomonas_salina.1